ncbi:MAG: hypothetical protein KJO03_00315 [Gammaproteobacteria bacterium]|nr:hypothetical protein [Gammaproteobacteria bacterium]
MQGIERSNNDFFSEDAGKDAAKEVVVGTLDTLYSQLARQDAGGVAAEDEFDFWQSVNEAAATVPENLSGLTDMFGDPLQMDVGDIHSLEAAAAAQEVDDATFGAMIKRFDGQAGAFAYLLFILLYFPCVATIGAIRREAGTSWAVFVAAWTTTIAYITASGFYQISTFTQHPLFSALWLAGTVILMIGLIYGLRQWAHRETEKEPDATEMGT